MIIQTLKKQDRRCNEEGETGEAYCLNGFPQPMIEELSPINLINSTAPSYAPQETFRVNSDSTDGHSDPLGTVTDPLDEILVASHVRRSHSPASPRTVDDIFLPEIDERTPLLRSPSVLLRPALNLNFLRGPENPRLISEGGITAESLDQANVEERDVGDEAQANIRTVAPEATLIIAHSETTPSALQEPPTNGNLESGDGTKAALPNRRSVWSYLSGFVQYWCSCCKPRSTSRVQSTIDSVP
jgi:hypothetical protein